MSKDVKSLWSFEGLLVAAFAVLVFQVFPSLWFGLILALDFRGWPPSIWMGLNFVILAGLFVVRFGPQLHEDWKRRRAQLAKVREKELIAMRAKEERARIQELRRARSRRVY